MDMRTVGDKYVAIIFDCIPVEKDPESTGFSPIEGLGEKEVAVIRMDLDRDSVFPEDFYAMSNIGGVAVEVEIPQIVHTLYGYPEGFRKVFAYLDGE